MGDPPTSICLTSDRLTAIYLHLFTCKKVSLEAYAGPWPLTRFMPDTDAHLPKHQRSGWAVSGPWGTIGYGTRWPDRWMVVDALISGLVEGEDLVAPLPLATKPEDRWAGSTER